MTSKSEPGSTVTCLCGAIKFPTTAALPNSTELCHCAWCRQSTGALFAGFCLLPTKPDDETLAKCSIYKTSNAVDRYFCSTCGTKVFINTHRHPDGTARDRWTAPGGAIEPPSGTQNVLNAESHYYLKNTVDGGMASFMTTLGGRSIPCYDTDEQSPQLSPETLRNMARTAASRAAPQLDEILEAKCLCGGVSLHIQPANHAPDSSIPHLDRFIPKDARGDPTNKHMAFCCVCRSCRLQSGVSLTPWTYIPRVQILNAHTGKPVAQHRDAGTAAGVEANRGLTLTHYQSSESACRSFCAGCGASVFYSTDSRPEVDNVAAGLLRADDVVLARRWLSWQWGRTPWKDETTQRDVSDAWRATADA